MAGGGAVLAATSVFARGWLIATALAACPSTFLPPLEQATIHPNCPSTHHAYYPFLLLL